MQSSAASKDGNHLGLVCVTAGEEVRFRTITRTRLHRLSEELQTVALRSIYVDNTKRLAQAIELCRAKRIRLYRLSSSLFPSSEEGPGHAVLNELAPLLAETGERATELGIRIVMHPDQFVVLSSEKPAVIENSIKILEHHARVLDLLKQPRSSWAALEIHGGKGGRGETLVDVIRALPDGIRTRLALENDEHAYGAREILSLCGRAGVPMVFDAHHHVCHEGLNNYEHPSIREVTEAAAATWPRPSWQMVHISNGRDHFRDPKHADYIDVMPSAFRGVPWIEVEAKQKELAIDRLRERWADRPDPPDPAAAYQSCSRQGTRSRGNIVRLRVCSRPGSQS